MLIAVDQISAAECAYVGYHEPFGHVRSMQLKTRRRFFVIAV